MRFWNSLVIQGLGVCALTARAWVRSLVWELRSCHQCGMPPNKTKLVSEIHSRVQGCLLVGNVFIHHTMDNKIKPINPKRNQPWIFNGRTVADAEVPILWSPDERNWLTGKDSNARKDWGQEKGLTHNEMVGWHHRHDRHELEQTLSDGGGLESLVCCSPWGH